MAKTPLTVVVAGSRRRALLACLGALAEQVDAPPFDAVVVLDGPDEDTAAALVKRAYPFDTMLLEQSRRGLQHARDLGASAARGGVLLFADENVVADPQLVAGVQAGHDAGADVLQPVIEIERDAPGTVVAQFAQRWAGRRRSRLEDGPLRPADVCASPLSITIATYTAMREKVGPPGFSHTGVGEDFRLGHGLNALGCRAEPLTGPGCSVTVGESLGELLSLSHEIGAADAALAATAPANAARIADARAGRWPTSPQAERTVAAAAARAAVEAAQVCTGLLGEARRGVLASDGLDRLDRAVALAYWLGHGGHDPPPAHPV